MEDINLKKETKKDIKDMNEAPRLESNKMYYNCSECSSTIEIMKFDENNIEFKCNNNHNIKMDIKNYLNKMKKYNNIKINDKTCEQHGDEYLSYCFDCNMHLCKECLKLGKHSYHYKIILMELIQNGDSLNEVFELIKQNKNKLKDLNIIKNKTEKKLYNIKDKNINEIKNKLNKKKVLNNKKEEKEITTIHYNFEKEIKKLKEEYENKIKIIKFKYDKNINNIKNKFKIINNIDNYIYNKKICDLERNVKFKIESYKFKERIEKLSDFNEIIEIIYNTYIKYNNNYYNIININNIHNMILNKEKNLNESSKNLIKNYENQINEKNNIIQQYELKLKEKDIIISNKIKEIKNEKNNIENYKNRIKEINDENDKFKKNNENYLNEISELKSKIYKIEKEKLELKEKLEIKELFEDSKIILDIKSKIFLKNCLNKIPNFKTNLIYSARIHGDTIEAFNSKCNGMANTLTIVKTNNDKIIGGFFKKALSVKDDYYDPDCFLFSVTSEEKYDVDPNGSKKNYSFYGTGSSSAIIDFGYGSSIHIINKCLETDSNYYCGRNETFKFPNHRINNFNSFIVIEFEVFQVKEN